MRERIIDLLDRADVAISSCAGVVDESDLRPLIESVRNARTRLGYPAEILVVALAGGTGSGKSSLLNAMVGEDVLEVGGVRPTTSRPEALVPSAAMDSMAGYLDRIEVERRHASSLRRICLIDLPDIDSVETAHHHRVDRLLPQVDLVVWVIDPEKYKDSRVHDDYLKPMAPWAAQFMFVLNQVDRVTADQADAIRDDLVEALEADGIESPRVLLTAAAPTTGEPRGIEELVWVVEERGETRDVLYDKVLTDLETTAFVLETHSAVPSDFDARAALVKDTAEASLVGGDLELAVDGIVDFLTDLAEEVGGPTGKALLGLASAAPKHLLRVDGEVPVATNRPKRWWRWGDTADDLVSPGPVLDEAIFRPARALLARHTVAVESVTELARDVESLRTGTRR